MNMRCGLAELGILAGIMLLTTGCCTTSSCQSCGEGCGECAPTADFAYAPTGVDPLGYSIPPAAMSSQPVDCACEFHQSGRGRRVRESACSSCGDSACGGDVGCTEPTCAAPAACAPACAVPEYVEPQCAVPEVVCPTCAAPAGPACAVPVCPTCAAPIYGEPGSAPAAASPASVPAPVPVTEPPTPPRAAEETARATPATPYERRALRAPSSQQDNEFQPPIQQQVPLRQPGPVPSPQEDYEFEPGIGAGNSTSSYQPRRIQSSRPVSRGYGAEPGAQGRVIQRVQFEAPAVRHNSPRTSDDDLPVFHLD